MGLNKAVGATKKGEQNNFLFCSPFLFYGICVNTFSPEFINLFNSPRNQVLFIHHSTPSYVIYSL